MGHTISNLQYIHCNGKHNNNKKIKKTQQTGIILMSVKKVQSLNMRRPQK